MDLRFQGSILNGILGLAVLFIGEEMNKGQGVESGRQRPRHSSQEAVGPQCSGDVWQLLGQSCLPRVKSCGGLSISPQLVWSLPLSNYMF